VLGWARSFLSYPEPFITLAVLVLVGLAAHRPLARALGWSPWPTLGALLGAAAIAALTLPPAPGMSMGDPDRQVLVACLRRLSDPRLMWWGMVHPVSRGEQAGNVLMFVPLTFFGTLAARRPLLVAMVGMLLPAGVEISQAVLGGGRDCAAFDWGNNAVGALLGVLAGSLILAVAACWRWIVADRRNARSRASLKPGHGD
jgi:hypothetical protein